MASVERMLNKAVTLHRQGQLEEAERLYQQILRRKREHPDALNLLGVIALGRGELDRAEKLIRRAIKRAPKAHTFLNHLGEALRRKGQLKEAEAAYKKSLRLQPRYIEALIGLGNVHRDRGALAAAAEIFERARALKPNDVAVLQSLAGAHIDARRLEDAAAIYAELTRLQPDVVEHQRQAGMLHHNLGAREAALAYMRAALRLDPGDLETLRLTVEALRLVEFAAPAPFFAQLIARLLGDGRFDPRELVLPAMSLVKVSPPVRAALDGEIDVDALARDDLFMVLTSSTLAPNLELEDLYVALRRRLLDGVDEKLTPLIAAVALQAHTAEYVWPVTPEEEAEVEARLAALRRRVFIGPEEGAALAILACYRPLERCGLASALSQGPWSKPLGFLLRETVEAAQREAALLGELPQLTPITHGTSEAVRAQYEESPYPRWRRIGRGPTQPLSEALQQALPRLTVEGWPARPRVLVAGCGSGHQPLRLALTHPEADILAVDLSLASLAYARRVADQMKVDNLELAQADILALPATLGPFDYIEAEGVLHHLEDPLAGWRVLRGLLKPRGLMRVSLYSEAGRADVRAARALIEREGLTPDLEGIRRLRAAMRAAGSDLCRRRDFFTASMCRDLAFHVQEHRYTIPRLRDELRALELELLDVVLLRADQVREFHARFPEGDTRDLALWEAFEADDPDLFRGMYRFICQAPGA